MRQLPSSTYSLRWAEEWYISDWVFQVLCALTLKIPLQFCLSSCCLISTKLHPFPASIFIAVKCKVYTCQKWCTRGQQSLTSITWLVGRAHPQPSAGDSQQQRLPGRGSEACCRTGLRTSQSSAVGSANCSRTWGRITSGTSTCWADWLQSSFAERTLGFWGALSWPGASNTSHRKEELES